MLPDAVLDAIDQIRLDRLRGAAALAQQAAEALLAAVPAFAGVAPEAERDVVIELARRLVHAQPSMAPLVNLASALLWRSESAGLQRAITETCREFLAGLEASAAAVRRHGAALIEDGACVITHSFSQTVLEALLAAREEGKRFAVVCTESRPQGEGVMLARRLGASGIEARLIVDAAIYARMPAASLALVGADSVGTHGLTNKIGTGLLALAARAFRKPCYALCGGEKFLPAGFPPPPEPPRSPLEIVAEPPANVTVENFYFETMPFDLFTGMVTEAGLVKPAELVPLLESRPVHPALVPLL